MRLKRPASFLKAAIKDANALDSTVQSASKTTTASWPRGSISSNAHCKACPLPGFPASIRSRHVARKPADFGRSIGTIVGHYVHLVLVRRIIEDSA